MRRLSDLEEDQEEIEDEAFREMLAEYPRCDFIDECERKAAEGGFDRDEYLAGFREGFVEGADSIWSQVRHKL